MKKFLAYKLLAYIFVAIFGAWLCSDNAFAVDCCVVDSTNIPKYTCYTNVQQEIDCLNKAKTLITESDTKKIYTKENKPYTTAFIVQSCEQECSAKQKDLALRQIGNEWCCLDHTSTIDERMNAKAICTKIKSTESCSNSKNTLYQRPCHTVEHCSQYGKPPETDLKKLSEQHKKALEEQKAKLLKEQVKPKFGVALPGFGAFEDISVESNDKGELFISVPWIAQYITWIYGYAIGISGIVAVILIMIGGFLWITSGGNPENVTKAKGYITSAVFGLVLILTAYLILNFINPSLINPRPLKFEIPKLAQQSQELAECNYSLSDPANKDVTIKNGVEFCVNYEDETKFVNLGDAKNKLDGITVTSGYVTKELYNALKEISETEGYLDDKNNETIVIHSSIRSLSSQKKLCNCWKTKEATNQCPSASGCGACNFAGLPGCGGTGHQMARAIDINLTGKTLNCGSLAMKNNCRKEISDKYKGSDCSNPEYKKCQDKLYDIMVDVGFKPIPKEWWHFNF